MLGHGRQESRFDDAPSLSSLRGHARRPSQVPAPPLPSFASAQVPHPRFESNLPRPTFQPSILGNHCDNKTSTSSKTSARSQQVKSSRRGSLQNKPGISLEAWQQYAAKGPIPLPSRKDNPYGVYMVTTSTSGGAGTTEGQTATKGFRAAGYGTGIPVSVQTSISTSTNRRTSTMSTGSSARPTSQLQAQNSDSRISRFEDALDLDRPESRAQNLNQMHAQRPGSSFRSSRFEDAYDTFETQPQSSGGAGNVSRIPRLSAEGDRNRQKGILSEVLFDHDGMSDIKEEIPPTSRSTGITKNVSQTQKNIPYSSEPLKSEFDHTIRSASAAGMYRTSASSGGNSDRRGSVSSESKLALYGAQDRETFSDKASIRTTDTFGVKGRTGEVDMTSVKTARTVGGSAGTYGRQANLPVQADKKTEREAYYQYGTEKDSKARKSLAGVFGGGKGPGSVKSFGTTKTSMTAADLSMDKENSTVRRAKGSWSSSQTFGDKWQSSPRERKLTKTPEPLPPKVEIVGTIRDAFPVVRESIELDAQRGLMPAFHFDAKSAHDKKQEGTHRDLRAAVQGHGLPPSAYKRGMTPEPFLEYRARNKSSASPLLTKMKSAWHLNGHQTSQSADLEKIEEMLTADEKPQPPMSGLAKMKSNLNLSRFRSHKASLADIQANARQQAGHSTNDSFTYVEPSVGDRSTISEWTLASVSSVSDGLPAPWEENGSQGGGKRVIKKKKSMAPGALLEKMFGGKPGKDKKEKRDSRDRFSLKNAASQLTLRPKANRSGSDSASVNSAASIRSQDRKSSFANTRRMTMVQSTDPAFVMDEIEPPSLPKKRSTSPIDAISPQLPDFSFSQPLTSGSDLRAGVLGNESYVSRFGYGIDQELASERSPAESVEDNPPTSATFAYSLHSEYSRESQEDVEAGNRRTSSEENSLDVVENDLDYLRSRMSYFQGGNGEKRKSTGPLPKRSSVQGVFDVPDQLPTADNKVKEVARSTQGKLVVPERFPGSSLVTALLQPVRAGSATDLAKMSTVTDDLHHLVANFACYTPNSMLSATPTRGAGMISPSESQYLESESPTPISRSSTQMLGAKKSNATIRAKASPIKISPLRLALHNNLSKRYTPDGKGPSSGFNMRGDEETVGMPSRADPNDEELVDDEDSDGETVGNHLPQTFVTEPTPRGASAATFTGMARSDLPQLQTNLDRVIEKGSLASSFATLTPVDDDAPRESFDFTGEYAQLNENGCRQSFLAELDRLGLVIDETDNIPEAKGAKEIQPAITKRSSLNRDFKFGRPAPAALERAQPGIPSGGIPFVPRHSQHLPDDSLFSFASMSSIGRVVDTGISGNFVNIFEREFAAAQNPRPTQLHSAHKSWTDSLRSSVGRSRGSIDSIDSALDNTRASRHRRKNSSVDSAHSAMRRIGRPGVDSDRMFKTNCLYSIAGSPSNSQASPSEAKTVGKGSARYPGNAKPSYDTLLDYKPSGSKLDSLHDQTRQSSISQGNDSLFSTSSRNQSFSLFRPRPISCISDRSEVDLSSQDASPLARKSGEMLRRSQDVDRRAGHDRQQSTVDRSRSSRTLEATGDNSFTSIEGTNKPLPPRNSFSRSIQARLSSTPRLMSPSGSEPSSIPSTDVQSIISAMLDPPVTKSIREPKMRTGSQVESDIQAKDDRRNGWEKRETMDSLVSKYTSGSSRDSMKRWVDWQREAELEIEKSKMAWADTDASRAIVDKEFKPPSNLEDVARLIQISRYVNTSLAEASPGKQIARRAQVPMDAFDKAIAESAVEPPQHRPAALPTKFQRTDTSGTIASATASTTPATPSGLFSFAMTQPVRESPVRLPLVDTSNVHGTSPSRRSPRKSLTKKNTKTIGPVRNRVTSTASARRAKLGWGRRRDSATASVPKVPGPRTPSKRSSGEDDERRQDNGLLIDDRRRSGYKARNSQNRRSIRA